MGNDKSAGKQGSLLLVAGTTHHDPGSSSLSDKLWPVSWTGEPVRGQIKGVGLGACQAWTETCTFLQPLLLSMMQSHSVMSIHKALLLCYRGEAAPQQGYVKVRGSSATMSNGSCSLEGGGTEYAAYLQ